MIVLQLTLWWRTFTVVTQFGNSTAKKVALEALDCEKGDCQSWVTNQSFSFSINSSTVILWWVATGFNTPPNRVPAFNGRCSGTVTWCVPLTLVVSRMWEPSCLMRS